MRQEPGGGQSTGARIRAQKVYFVKLRR